MVKKFATLLAALAVGGTLMLATSAAAQTSTSSSPSTATPVGPATNDPGHPRVNQVDNRLEHQQDRIQQGLKDRTLNQQQALDKNDIGRPSLRLGRRTLGTLPNGDDAQEGFEEGGDCIALSKGPSVPCPSASRGLRTSTNQSFYGVPINPWITPAASV
jgi:hypothetical protein